MNSATGDRSVTDSREVTSARTIHIYWSLFQSPTVMTETLYMQCKGGVSTDIVCTEIRRRYNLHAAASVSWSDKLQRIVSEILFKSLEKPDVNKELPELFHTKFPRCYEDYIDEPNTVGGPEKHTSEGDIVMREVNLKS